MVTGGLLCATVLWFYCNISTGLSGEDEELDLKIRKQLPSTLDLAASDVLLVSRAHWIANKPGLFAVGVLWVICSILFTVIVGRYSDLRLCIPGIVLLSMLYTFSRLNFLTVKKSGIAAGIGFPVEEIIDLSYGETLNVKVTQIGYQRLLSVYDVTISEKGGDPIKIPLSDGLKVARIIENSGFEKDDA